MISGLKKIHSILKMCKRVRIFISVKETFQVYKT